MVHQFTKVEHDTNTRKFLEISQDSINDLTEIEIEIGFFEEDGTKSMGTIGNITLTKKELHTVIGTLLHVQQKMK